MQYYSVQTTVDITKHDQGINSLDDHSAAQQQNFHTLLQGIGLRANVFWDNDPKFDGKYWHWLFYVEWRRSGRIIKKRLAQCSSNRQSFKPYRSLSSRIPHTGQRH